ncbi:hypothetical protein ABTA80_19735, partial [Acinetobacter baumannii]
PAPRMLDTLITKAPAILASVTGVEWCALAIFGGVTGGVDGNPLEVITDIIRSESVVYVNRLSSIFYINDVELSLKKNFLG